jgi:DNA-binding MarR family transcriptional regulator
MENQGLGQYIRTLSKLARELKSNFTPEEGFPLNKTEFVTLMELKTYPGMPMKHYQYAAGIESGSFTYLADDLEKKGVARRVPAEDDKRKTVLELTDTGSRMADVILARADVHVSKKLASLSDSQRAEFAAAMSVLEDILTQLEKQHG